MTTGRALQWRWLALLVAALWALPRWAAAAPAQWQKWDGCVLLADRYFDGDSFHIRHRGREFVLRLYFVDAPETSTHFPARVAAQSGYFGASQRATLEAGEAARRLTARFLSRPFRVHTRLKLAPGAGRLPRRYALVERDGARLDGALVQAGLARVSGEVADFPDLAAGRRRQTELRSLETRAAAARAGLWSGRPAGSATTATALRRPVNVNTASRAQLELLPGIGPSTAAAIIAARPIASLAALEAVRGLGAKTISRLRPRVTFR